MAGWEQEGVLSLSCWPWPLKEAWTLQSSPFAPDGGFSLCGSPNRAGIPGVRNPELECPQGPRNASPGLSWRSRAGEALGLPPEAFLGGGAPGEAQSPGDSLPGL